MEENVKQSGFFSDEMTIIKGVVATSNNLVIAGKFTGTIASIASVTISEGAEVEADIIADSVTVIGKFNGKLTARDLVTVCKGSLINGKVSYGRLNVEDGAVVCASTSMITDKKFKKTSERDKIYRSITKMAAKKSLGK